MSAKVVMMIIGLLLLYSVESRCGGGCIECVADEHETKFCKSCLRSGYDPESKSCKKSRALPNCKISRVTDSELGQTEIECIFCEEGYALHFNLKKCIRMSQQEMIKNCVLHHLYQDIVVCSICRDSRPRVPVGSLYPTICSPLTQPLENCEEYSFKSCHKCKSGFIKVFPSNFAENDKCIPEKIEGELIVKNGQIRICDYERGFFIEELNSCKRFHGFEKEE